MPSYLNLTSSICPWKLWTIKLATILVKEEIKNLISHVQTRIETLLSKTLLRKNSRNTIHARKLSLTNVSLTTTFKSLFMLSIYPRLIQSFQTLLFFSPVPLITPSQSFEADDWMFRCTLLCLLFLLFDASLNNVMFPQLTCVITRQIECIITAFRNLLHYSKTWNNQECMIGIQTVFTLHLLNFVTYYCNTQCDWLVLWQDSPRRLCRWIL